MLLVPDPTAAYIDPFLRVPTLVLHCFVKDPVTGQMYSRDPRGIAKKAELHLKQTGNRLEGSHQGDFVIHGVGVGAQEHGTGPPVLFGDLHTHHIAVKCHHPLQVADVEPNVSQS